MPRRSLLSNEQRTRLFAIPVDHAEMAKHYVLSADDLVFVRTKRRSVNRLGFAVQLCLLRYPGLGMGPAEQPPEAMITFVAQQLGVRQRRLRRLCATGSDPPRTCRRTAKISGPAEFRTGRLARLPSGRHGRGMGHGSRRAHRPGDARPSADEQRPRCRRRRCWSGSGWPRVRARARKPSRRSRPECPTPSGTRSRGC